jgi:hypothetical protein
MVVILGRDRYFQLKIRLIRIFIARFDFISIFVVLRPLMNGDFTALKSQRNK